MFKNATIDYNELKMQDINIGFFEDYNNTRLVNSFLFNFSKLQDKIGAKLFRKVLYELKEINDIDMPMIDVLNILEKIGIIQHIEKWDEVREIRNSIAHEYPFDLGERVDNIRLSMGGFEVLKDIYDSLKKSYYR